MDDQVFTLREALFWAAGVLGVMTLKFLSWFMPVTASLWVEKIRKMLTKDVTKEVHELSAKVDKLIVENSLYKSEKHRVEGELAECKDAIQTKDEDKLRILKDHYDKK